MLHLCPRRILVVNACTVQSTTYISIIYLSNTWANTYWMNHDLVSKFSYHLFMGECCNEQMCFRSITILHWVQRRLQTKLICNVWDGVKWRTQKWLTFVNTYFKMSANFFWLKWGNLILLHKVQLYFSGSILYELWMLTKLIVTICINKSICYTKYFFQQFKRFDKYDLNL